MQAVQPDLDVLKLRHAQPTSAIDGSGDRATQHAFLPLQRVQAARLPNTGQGPGEGDNRLLQGSVIEFAQGVAE